MALNFPANPIPNQLYTDPSNNYTYQWRIDPQSLTDQGKWITRISTVSDNLPTYSSNPGPQAPNSPFVGQFWFNTTNSILYTWYDAGLGADWVATN